MKIRQGFVSNSSSSSFLVAFVPEEGNLNLKTFEFLLTKMDGDKVKMHKSTVIGAKQTVGQELLNYRAAREWIVGYLALLNKCMNNKEARLLVNELNTYNATKETTRVIKYKIGAKEVYDDSVLTDHINSYEQDLLRLNKEIASCEDILQKIDTLPDDMLVAKWEEDNWSDGLFGNLIEMLVEDGRVIILQKTIM